MREVLRLEKVRFLLAALVVATLASATGAASSPVSSASEDMAGCPADFLTDDPARWITTNGLDASAPSLAASQASRAGTYLARDRRLVYSTASVASTVGQKSSPTAGDAQTTTYVYDALGNLLSVTLPGGSSISYQIDGRNRRVGKRVGGVPTQGFLYESDLRPVAELDGGNNVVSRFVYGTKTNVPEYMVKGGATYRIITDHLGSPRLVVDVATGTVAQRMDYDEFGRVLNDTNPGFQPFGFAGGLYDKDTKLVRFGARDYDAATGRWTSKDPIGFEGGIGNLFVYGAGDPVNTTDPRGTVVVWRVLPDGVRMVRFSPFQPAMTTLGAAAEPFALTAGSAAALVGAFAAGYAVGSIIDCGATAALGQSLGDWLYNKMHPEENAPAQWPPQASYPGQSGRRPSFRPSW